MAWHINRYVPKNVPWEARGQAPLSEIDTSRGMAYGDDVTVEDYLLEVDE